MKKRNMIKKGLACVMVATMTIGLAACGGSNGGGDDVSEADFSDPESIKGTITVGGWPSGDDGFKAAMDGFNKEYPNIEVGVAVYRYNSTSSGTADIPVRR